MLALRVNETKVTTNNALNRDNFLTEGNQESNNDKKTFARHLYRLLTSDLTLRPQNTYIHAFRGPFDSRSF